MYVQIILKNLLTTTRSQDPIPSVYISLTTVLCRRLGSIPLVQLSLLNKDGSVNGLLLQQKIGIFSPPPKESSLPSENASPQHSACNIHISEMKSDRNNPNNKF